MREGSEAVTINIDGITILSFVDIGIALVEFGNDTMYTY
jgi:hypothetical protein